MDVQTQKRIFEPFFTTKFSGRGLGMSAVLGIIKSHDGLLQLSSTPGVGTTFRVFLPLPAIPDGFKAKSHDAPAPLLKGSGTILLVDDEEALRIIGCALLKAMGYSAIAATNGLEALEIFRAPGSGIDLIILDMLMPEMGGIEAYRLLRESSPSIPIVICSGFSIEDIGKDIADDQHVAVIQKPFKPDQLRYILMKLLEQAM